MAIVILGGFLIVAVMFIQFVMTPLQLEEADEFDRQAVERDMERVKNYLEKEEDDLSHQLIDWSAWDDTYFFINDENPDYVADNLQPDMIANIQVQTVILLDENGELAYTAGVDRDDTPFPIDKAFLSSVKEQGNKNHVFYEMHNDEMMMVASHEITRNDFSDPSGFMMMGRVIDDRYLAELSDALSVDVALASEARTAGLTQANKVVSEYQLENVGRSDAITLSVGADRAFHEEKVTNLKKFKMMAAIGFILIALMIYFLFKLLVLSPIVRLAAALRAHDQTVPVKRNRFYRNLLEVKQLENEFFGMIQDVQRANDDMTLMAYHDQLTGLKNRFYLQKHFEGFVTSSKNKKAVIFFDLDGFKKVNDTWGHEIGDLLLKEVAVRLKNYFPQEQVLISRIGGDEFIAVVSFEREEELLEAGSELKELISREFILGSVSAHVSASIGISIYPEDGTRLSTLLKKADAAMYEAKAGGKNKVLMYKKLVEAGKYLQSERLKEDSKTALKNRELSLVFQPVVSGENGHIIGAEALLRWEHPEIGPISPELFISMMEDNGVIHEVGKWVVTESLKQLHQWHNLGHRYLRLSVNFSKKQLLHKYDFLAHLDKQMKKYDIPPASFILEITESEVSYYDSDLMTFMQEVQRRGMKIALDDFGKGTASLHGLRKLPVDIVKIDRSFMESIPHEKFNTSMLTGIYSLLKQLKIGVVTEGVENKEQFSFITEQSNSNMQGYYFSKPIKDSELTEILLNLSEKAAGRLPENVYPFPKRESTNY
ncbi:hypothetical protein KP77_31420 [Jeotgalibacillus alimentarius]|uniref:Diguanylate cyclase n=1 Tax=Jeotgalibacillus alimentarius TaxID=135826 RepID=A0A0C2VFZ9_9BACL|nr:hypothetical protein KP77_31420 [Jeotgalibacillus alimentarius]